MDLARSSDFGVKTTSGLRTAAAHLAAEQVEDLRRLRAVGDLDVVLGAQREEPLDAGRAVLGALALVAVGQVQHEADGLVPLVLGRHDELVDDGGGAVPEVAELRLPDHERVLGDDRVAVLEPEGGVLGQQRVVDPELALLGAEVGQRRVLVAVGVVDEHRVAVAEGAPAGVLAGDADVGALEEQRAVGHRLGERPVDLAVGPQLVARLELLEQLRVHLEGVGERGQRARRCGRARPGRRRCRRGAARRSAGGGALASTSEVGADCRVSSRAVCRRCWKSSRAPSASSRESWPRFTSDSVKSFRTERRCVDLGVHERLRVAGVVALVVTVAAVADHVDDDVLVEPLAERERQPGHAHARLGVVAVHVEDRRLDHLGDVGGVEARARRLGRGGEADLVVDDHVDRAADAVALDVAHVERLGHHALAGERGVAVHEDRQDRERLGIVDGVLLGAGHADHDGSTASRWLGLAASSTVMSLPERATNLPVWPRWYFTSPEPCIESGSTWPSNSLKSWS